MSAALSTNTWQIPSACPITGILVDRWMLCTIALDPLGMTRSMWWSMFIKLATSSRLSTSWYACGPRRSAISSWMSFRRHSFECLASRPPFRISGLPERIPRATTWGRASGRDSKMTKITPKGTVSWRRTRPGVTSKRPTTLPIGSTCSEMPKIPCERVSSLALFNLRRASIWGSKLSLAACSRSFWLASRMMSALSTNILEIRLKSSLRFSPSRS
mmetsp:Transcript_147658/g.258161  ORF Transcript_147658/g.258161 Transcript_147658/m.258161 type:complete len:216 (-) Transcript_147658:702-1349(-)